jgi:2-C-methyl-D-erythritol 2,4-cyclodiphosphate synthase
MKVGIGQDSHRFIEGESSRKLILGGVVFDNCPALEGNSDADVVLHSITNAISGVTCVNVLGATSDKLCLEQGITDSSVFVLEALKHLQGKIVHLSISIECKRPLITPAIPLMRKRISELLAIPSDSIGITATSGEGLTDFGKGLGIQVISCITVE